MTYIFFGPALCRQMFLDRLGRTAMYPLLIPETTLVAVQMLVFSFATLAAVWSCLFAS